VPQDNDLQLILMPDGNSVPDPQNFARVSARLFAGLRSIAPPTQAAILHVNTLPDWFVTQVETEDLRRAYVALHAVLTQITQSAVMHGDLGPRHQAVLRVMIVHAWRRLALRHPLLPAVAHSRDWMGHACRVKVTALLDAAPRPPLDRI
jgi:phenylacetic acid degradation operon negative regulatory protein